MKKLAIVYSLKRHRKINGTLFYCFEYFLYLRSLGSKVDFVIHNASVAELESIFEIFKERYDFDFRLLSEVVRLDKLIDFYKFKYSKVLFLDVHTLELLGMLTSAEILCFSNISNGMVPYKEKAITYFGSYDYQTYNEYELLKFNFDVFRPISSCKDGVLVVRHDMDYRAENVPENLRTKNLFFKNPTNAIPKMFEQFSTLYYVQAGRLDYNNRLIPECYFYKKEIVIQRSGVIDSVIFRYEDIAQNGLEKYRLNENDKIITHFLQ